MENQKIGPFQVYEKLGSHRRHQVYHAQQAEQQREIALKFIKVPSNWPLEKALRKIQLESEILKSLSHPNLVKFYGAGIEANRIFFASRLIRGESLSTLLSRRTRLAPDMVIDYSRQIAACLSYIHENDLVHSKLTPDKVLIDRRGVVRLVDVRLNRARKRRWDAPRRHQMEIAAYMAPEVLLGKGTTAQSDIYSLGVMMYEMLTGELPFEPDTLQRMIRNKKQGAPPAINETCLNCPVWLEHVVTSLLEPNPRLRPRSAASVETALKEIKAFDRHKRTSFFQYVQRPFELQDENGSKKPASENRWRKWLSSNRGRRTSARTTLSAFCLICLLATMVIVAIIQLMPPDNEQLLKQAESYSRSPQVADLNRAGELYRQIIRRGDDDPTTEIAESGLLAIHRKLLLIHAETGGTGFDSSMARAFHHAYQAEREGEFENALLRYRHLVQMTEPEGDDRPIHVESLSRIDMLETKVADIAVKTHAVDKQILAARKAITNGDYAKARQILKSVIGKYSADRDLRWVVEKARSELRKLDS